MLDSRAAVCMCGCVRVYTCVCVRAYVCVCVYVSVHASIERGHLVATSEWIRTIRIFGESEAK